MTKIEALNKFFSSFGIPAHEENSVYAMDKPLTFPYLTYEIKTDSFGEFDTNISFSLWYRSLSWVAADAKSAEISAAIGKVGKFVDYDDGSVLIMRSSPWAQYMGDDSDDAIKRIVHNLKLRYYSNN